MKPQEETVLKIIYQTIDRPGPFEKRVILFTDIPEQQQISIAVKGKVNEAPVAKIKVEPRKLQLDTVDWDSVSPLCYRITNEGSEPLVISKIHRVEDGAVYFDGKKDGNLVIKPKEIKVLDLGFKPTGKGRFTQVIFFETNARNARNGRYAIMIMGEAAGK